MTSSNRHRRRPRSRMGTSIPGLGGLISGLSALARAPGRTLIAALVTAACLYAIAKTTLPIALAVSAPDLALRLAANEPAALMAKAELLRKELFGLAGTTDAPATQGQDGKAQPPTPAAAAPGSAQSAVRIESLPETSPDGRVIEAVSSRRDELRREIRALVTRALQTDPLNSTAMRMLAEVTEGTEEVRRLMTAAVDRSRLESPAVAWLLNDSVIRRDYPNTIRFAEILLRTRGNLHLYALVFLGQMAADDEGRALLIAKLKENARWRAIFFRSAPRIIARVDDFQAIVAALKETGNPVTEMELATYLDAIVRAGHVDRAYGLWTLAQSDERLARLGLITNPGFETEPSGIPFDWQVGRSRNATIEFAALPELRERRALHIVFGNGRSSMSEITQIVILGAARYRFEAKLRGTINAKRGLRWQIRCLGPGRRPIATTDMLLGTTRTWRLVTLDFEVPAASDCLAQEIRLFHDARSASEEIIEGDVWFDELSIVRTEAVAPQPAPEPKRGD